MDINIVIMSGRLTREPEVRYMDSGFAIAKTAIAVHRAKKKDEAEPKADFYDVDAFGKLAEFLEDKGFKGQRVVIVGRLENDEYENRDGQRVKKTKIIANNINVYDWRDRPADRLPNEEEFKF